jgi:UDP-4-amino-4,6-dideoxy-N-acetyl-beta-L-altrosamine transaminase
MIPFSKQSISRKDIDYVVKVLKSDFLTQGPNTIKFEKKISQYTNSKYTVSSNSGSSSLHLACLALGLSKNEIVWTVPNTFAASANCALNCGAKIDFVDIDKETWNIDIKLLKNKLIESRKKRILPKILITVHFAGQPADQKEIWKLSKEFNFKIIEDASHSLGSKHHGEKTGSCKWSSITVFSFYPTKIITTGEGGAATTNDKNLAEKMKMYRTNGITKNSSLFSKKNKNSPWYYEHQTIGFNYRMNELSAALGLSQLSRINKFTKERNRIANKYKKIFKNMPVKFQKIEEYNYSSYHLMVVKFDLNKFKYTYKKIFNKLRAKGFYVNLHYMPLHLSPYFKKNGFKKKDFPVSENFSNMSMSIPIYYGLQNKKVYQLYKIIQNFIK